MNFVNQNKGFLRLICMSTFCSKINLFHILNCYIEWVNTSWTYSRIRTVEYYYYYLLTYFCLNQHLQYYHLQGLNIAGDLLVEYGEGTLSILVNKLFSYIQASLAFTHVQSFREKIRLTLITFEGGGLDLAS